MNRYERENDSFIVPDEKGTFGMRDNPQVWQKRAESFDDPQSYLIFGRRMELSLRTALDITTNGREGLPSVFRDLLSAPQKFEPVKKRVREEIASPLKSASIADCGAGTGSLLSYIEWSGLPYPKHLTLLEPNGAHYDFLQQRIEGEVASTTNERLQVLGKDVNTRHDNAEHVEYVVYDVLTDQQSQIQIIHAAAQEGGLPVAESIDRIIFVGISKYFRPNEFKDMIINAQTNFYGQDGGITAFNTQAKKDLLPDNISSIEQIAYKAIKMLKQTVMTGRPTLHNFYGKEDIDSFPGESRIVHNGGDAIVVGLKQDR